MKPKEWKAIEHPDEGLDDITLPEFSDTNLVDMHLTDIELAQRKLGNSSLLGKLKHDHRPTN